MSQSFGIMFGDGRSLGALIVSALLHVAIAVGVAASSKASAARVRDDVVRPDAWSGNTFQVDALLAQAAFPQAAEPKAAEPVPAVPATPAPAEVKEPVRTRSVRPPPPRAAATASEPPSSPESPAPFERSSENETSSERAAAAPRASRRPRSQEDAGGAAAEAPQTYGAAGQAAMERSLAKAFTRAIPAAISKDPIWSELELGHAGSAKLEITIDEDGKIASVEPERPPPRQLKRLLDRTLILAAKRQVRSEPRRRGRNRDARARSEHLRTPRQGRRVRKPTGSGPARFRAAEQREGRPSFFYPRLGTPRRDPGQTGAAARLVLRERPGYPRGLAVR